ncbi:restriction endonuclease subunit S [Loktanella salsilacus]|uniref:restriction endonuclease subunit S n=1 Tax=Loktanella salsilacus TaxID=195913 RepID=UPI0037363660
MREEWQEKQLGEICELVNGRGFKPHEWKKEGLPIIRIQNLNGSDEFNYYSGDFNPKILVEPGQLLFAWSGSRGSSFGPHIWQGPTGVLNYHTWKVHPATETEKDFLFQLLQFETEKIEASSHGAAALVHVQKGEMEHRKFYLPPPPEQRKIAAILRTWDEALEKFNALRALNIRRRVWLRTHLFTGKVRLPGFTGEWRKVPLSDVLYEHRSKSTGTEEVYSVSVHKGLVNQVEHLGRSFSAANTDHYNRVLPGDIVYTKSPTGDFPLGIIKQSKIDREVIVSPLYGVFTPQSYALGVILDALFESPLAARNYLHPLVQKGAKNTIAVTNKQFLEGKLHLPMDLDEQAAIADVVNTSHAELACLDAEIKALTDQKRGLMQKLLTGEWRVEVDTVEIPTNTKEAEHAG